MQDHEISSNVVIYYSPPLHDNLHMKALSPHPTRDPNPDICEDDLHAGQHREGKMKCHDMTTKTVAGVFMDLNQENLKYMDVADAGKTPFESEMLMQ